MKRFDFLFLCAACGPVVWSEPNAACKGLYCPFSCKEISVRVSQQFRSKVSHLRSWVSPLYLACSGATGSRRYEVRLVCPERS